MFLLSTLHASGEDWWPDEDDAKLSKKMWELLHSKRIERNNILDCKKGEKLAAVFYRFKEMFHKKYPDIEFPLYLSPEVADWPVDKEIIEGGYSAGYCSLLYLVDLIAGFHPIKLSCNGDVFFININEKEKKQMEERAKNPPSTNENLSKTIPDDGWQEEYVASIPPNVLTIKLDYLDNTHCLTTIGNKKFKTPDSVDLYLRQLDKELYKNGIHIQKQSKLYNEMESVVTNKIKIFIKEHNVDLYYSTPIESLCGNPIMKISKRNNNNICK